MVFFHFLLIATAWHRVLGASDSCSSSVIISSQSDADNLSSCDNFEGSITISSSVNGAITINNVEEIKGSLIAEGVSGLTKLIAPDLDTLNGALTLSNLASLNTLTMGALSRVSSGITITGNPKLRSVGFSELEEVDGLFKLTGSFTSVSLPSLDQAKGQTTIKGANSMTCSTLNQLQSEGVFKSSYSCTAGSSGLSGGAKGGIAAGVIMAVFLFLLVLWFVLRRRQQKRRLGGTAPIVSSPSTAVIQVEKSTLAEENISPANRPQKHMPRKPVGSAILLDGRSIHEAPIAATPVQECHELDAGPVLSSHQRPIHREQKDTDDPETKLNDLGDQENGHVTQP